MATSGDHNQREIIINDEKKSRHEHVKAIYSSVLILEKRTHRGSPKIGKALFVWSWSSDRIAVCFGDKI